jgi:hypothetical protein
MKYILALAIYLCIPAILRGMEFSGVGISSLNKAIPKDIFIFHLNNHSLSGSIYANSINGYSFHFKGMTRPSGRFTGRIEPERIASGTVKGYIRHGRLTGTVSVIRKSTNEQFTIRLKSRNLPPPPPTFESTILITPLIDSDTVLGITNAVINIKRIPDSKTSSTFNYTIRFYNSSGVYALDSGVKYSFITPSHIGNYASLTILGTTNGIHYKADIYRTKEDSGRVSFGVDCRVTSDSSDAYYDGGSIY